MNRLQSDQPLKPETRRIYRSAQNHYLRDVRATGLDAQHPNLDWLITWLYHIAQTVSVKFARRAVTALQHYFADNGVPNVLADPRVTAALCEPALVVLDPSAPLEVRDLSNAQPLMRRVSYYHRLGHSEGYKLELHRRGESWEAYAREHRFDPRRPSPERVAAFLAMLGDSNAGNTIKKWRTTLRYYFKAAGTPDVTRSRAVRRLIEGLMREKPPIEPTALFPNDVRVLVSGFGNQPCDIRDRLIILLCYFGGLTTGQLLVLDRSQCVIDNDEVVVGPVRDYRKVAHVGSSRDPQLDPKRWLVRWLKIIGTDAGPLFPATSPRGGFKATAMCSAQLDIILRNAGLRLGKDIVRVGQGLRKGFAIEGRRRFGVVATAQHLGYTDLTQMETYDPSIGLMQKKLKLLMGRGLGARRFTYRSRQEAKDKMEAVT